MCYERKQQLSLDAAITSFKFVRLTYSRLVTTIKSYSENPDKKGIITGALLDCWTIVDLTKRINAILHGTLGLTENKELKAFLKLTKTTIDFRHYIQHLERKIKNIASTGNPVWGHICWFNVLLDNEVGMGMHIPGTLASGKHRGLNPLGRTFYDEIDHITLLVDKDSVNISEIVRNIDRFEKVFCETVKTAKKLGKRDDKGILSLKINNWEPLVDKSYC